jgi:hypothetical protein
MDKKRLKWKSIIAICNFGKDWLTMQYTLKDNVGSYDPKYTHIAVSNILERQEMEGKGLNGILKSIPDKIASYCLIQ